MSRRSLLATSFSLFLLSACAQSVNVPWGADQQQGSTADAGGDLRVASTGRLKVFDVWQGEGAERIRVASYVQDSELRTQVGLATAEDGEARWLPVNEWAPYAEAQAAPAASHSSAAGLWLNNGCTEGFAITPPLTRPRFVWQRLSTGIAVWRIGDISGNARDVSNWPLYQGKGGSSDCNAAPDTIRSALLTGRGAWSLGEHIEPRWFVPGRISATLRE